MSIMNFKQKPNDDSHTHTSETDGSQTVADENVLLQEVMSDNLELMLEIVLKVREDEEFAKSIYADCPRLQNLLDQNPDLRPIFEDPNLVRINFEQVYRNAGGVLPEDKPNIYVEKLRKALACVVQHPLFKVFKFLLLIKKCYHFVFGGGLATLRNFFSGIFGLNAASTITDSLNGDGQPGDVDVDGNNADSANRETLYRAADHMEDPDVQEQMKLLLDGDPDQLDEAIEQDPDLKALRESNPLCAELMSDPSTMKILVDPDNLRALGDCPDLIQADFADPDWSPPDMESVQFDDAAMGTDGTEAIDTEAELEAEPEAEPFAAPDESTFLEEYERGDANEPSAANNKKQQPKQQKENDEQTGNGGFFASLGTGLVDYIAAQTVGISATELMGGGGDDAFGLDQLEDQADQVADTAADTAAAKAEQLAATAEEYAMSDELERKLEDSMGHIEEAHDQLEEANAHEHEDQMVQEAQTIASTAAMGGALVAGGTSAASGGRAAFAEGFGTRSTVAEGTARAAGNGGSDDDKEDKAEEEAQPQKSKFRRISKAIGSSLVAFGAATKEYAVTAVVGADLAAEIVGRMEEDKKEGGAKKEK